MANDAPSFPSKDQLLAYILESKTPVGKRELARAFNIKGADRQRLKELLRALKEEGLLDAGGGDRQAAPGRLPNVTVVEVTGLDEDGELLARPVSWDEAAGPPPVIYMSPERRSQGALASGERVLARLSYLGEATYEGRTIRRLGQAPQRLLGVYETGGGAGRLRPTDKRMKRDFILRSADTKGAQPGELVLAEVKPHRPRVGPPEVVVVECLGGIDNQRALSLIAIHEHGLPSAFDDEALAEAAAAGPVTLGKRRDLRDLPLVTIDGADARDFDDAVFAEPDDSPGNPGGWHLIVAIADVAHYVRPGSALDRAAQERGNSAYFPDRVVPMLPEALSNGWCSLKPQEERGCLAAHLWIDGQGKLIRHRFERGLMRSAARLTYDQVQAARDGKPDDACAALAPVIAPLYGAYEALLAARHARGTLDLEMTERQVLFDEAGTVAGIEPRQRYDSHRLIEEFMIAANVAAAIELERRQQPCMYRIHEDPDAAKVEALREVLAGLGLRLARGQVIRPWVFTRVLEQVEDDDARAMVSELILRAQAQARYAPDNLGHFGLALTRYAHFTSPIRRYSDLLVHRGLIAGLGLGEGGLRDEDAARFEWLGEHISMTERRAAAAERDAIDRLTAAFLKERVGATFSARVSGVTRFGLFVMLDDNGADGLIPVSSLPDDYYLHDEKRHCLVGRRWGRSYRLGERLRVRLAEANPMTGGLIFTLSDGEDDGDELPDFPTSRTGWSPHDKPGGTTRSLRRKARGRRR